MEPIFTIYKATNLINGKSYIGYDSDWPQRKHSHKSYAKLGKGKNRIFPNAIRKHGWNSFQWNIEYQSNDENFTRTIMEEYFIRLYSTHYTDGRGYNMSYGGEGEKGNKSRTGMPHTKEALFRCSENRKGKGCGERNGMKRSEVAARCTMARIKTGLERKSQGLPWRNNRKKPERIKTIPTPRIQTAQTRAKISASLKGRRRGPYKKNNQEPRIALDISLHL